ncbi:hypothetical protein CCMA1212_009029 [Trichoderma ghanense]|uniref:Uncharacterized protein n=1 Tax=Trichoderma ghanense TaxID=65468 RepID=A0ABY2GTY3_9HYPO
MAAQPVISLRKRKLRLFSSNLDIRGGAGIRRNPLPGLESSPSSTSLFQVKTTGQILLKTGVPLRRAVLRLVLLPGTVAKVFVRCLHSVESHPDVAANYLSTTRPASTGIRGHCLLWPTCPVPGLARGWQNTKA